MNPLDAVNQLGHAESLGRLEDLPADYVKAINDLSVAPLWPQLRGLLPRGQPSRATQPFMWRYQDVRPHLLRAGELTPIEKAERRVLVLCNPGHGIDKLVATPTIYVGLQLILPGEVAPNHRHTPTAVRFVIEGEGGYTTVNGEKCPMHKGDLILTPALNWHEHGHEGRGPVIWMDALDLPMIYAMEASYAIEGPSQPVRPEADASQNKYRRAGLLPYASLAQAQRPKDPQIRFPWADVRAALGALATVTDKADAEDACDGVLLLAAAHRHGGLRGGFKDVWAHVVCSVVDSCSRFSINRWRLKTLEKSGRARCWRLCHLSEYRPQPTPRV